MLGGYGPRTRFLEIFVDIPSSQDTERISKDFSHRECVDLEDQTTTLIGTL
jgi:hypothetical protein